MHPSALLPKDHDQVLDAFLSAGCLALREWAGTEVAAGPEPPGRTGGDLWAVVRFPTGPFAALVLRCSAPTAGALARRVLTEVAAEPDEALIRDCLGEVANIIAGQAKALLAGTPFQFTFSPPQVGSSAGREVEWQNDRPSLGAVFTSDLGEMALQLVGAEAPGPER